MVVTQDDALAEKLRLLRSHGMTSLTWDRHKGHAWSYDVVDLGYNYRIDEMRSALGRVQLEKLRGHNQLRQECTLLYQDLLQELCPEVGVPFEGHPGKSACHLMPILLPDGVVREEIMEKMKAKGVQTSIHYPPIHHFSAYSHLVSGSRLDLKITDALAPREVTLPLYPALSSADVRYVVETLREAIPDISEP